MTTRTEIEHDLRAVARSFDEMAISSDAWQQNQQRLAIARSRRPQRWIAAAAAVVVLLLLGGIIVLAARGGGSAPPAQEGGDDSFAPQNLLGQVVPLETLTVNGERTVHEGALSDIGDKGPSLCDRYVAESSASGACAARDPNADDKSVAVDWLFGTRDGGDSHGVVAGVDERVAHVRLYLSNGEMVLPDLRSAGWHGTKLFASTLQDKTAPGVPQRLVAYADAGTVLQAVDLADVFSDAWLPPSDGCAKSGAPTAVPGLHVTAAGDARSVELKLEPPAGSARTVCLDLRQPVQGVVAGPKDVVVVVAPEVENVMVATKRAFGATYTEPVPVPGTMWRVIGIHEDKGWQPNDGLVAVDQDSDHKLFRVTVDSLS